MLQHGRALVRKLGGPAATVTAIALAGVLVLLAWVGVTLARASYHITETRNALREDRIDAAQRHITQGLKLRPGSAEVHFLAGRVARRPSGSSTPRAASGTPVSPGMPCSSTPPPPKRPPIARPPMRRLHAFVPHLSLGLARARRSEPFPLPGPLVLGGKPWDPGPVIDASPDARVLGVRRGMPLASAHRLVPEATFVEPDLDADRRAAETVFEAWTLGDEACAAQLMTPAARVELFGLDGSEATDQFQGCFEVEEPDPAMDCAFTHEGGSTHFLMNFGDTTGWTVFDVFQVAD